MLEQERRKVSFDTNQLSYLIYGGSKEYNQFLEMQRIVSNDPILKFNPQHLQLPRKELIQLAVRQLVRYHELFQFNINFKSREFLFFSKLMPLGLHFSMFLMTLNNLCDDKQRQLFLFPAFRGEILGCYAQTQLSHGSDVQNLETTAVYDKNTQTFILNSPTPGSLKWWIGALGLFATHAAVIAQLIINNKRYGVQVFIVNVRDIKTHLLLEGIEAGDIGPKYGFHTMDNGYLKLTNVRIPRHNMLMKYSQVSKQGQFSRKGNQRITFATMLTTRVNIPNTANYGLCMGITIATRYSLVRTQFISEQGKEIQIFDYQLQREKILPHISEAYAIVFGAKKMKQIGNQVVNQIKQKNDFKRLNPTHALSSGIKAIFTTDTTIALQTLRKSAGGHGFSQYSAFTTLLQEVSPTSTYEGQNTILLLQTARFLLKGFQSIQQGKKVVDFIDFLLPVSKKSSLHVTINRLQAALQPQNLKNIFMNLTYAKIVYAGQKLKQGLQLGLSPKQSWDFHAGISLTQAAEAFIYCWVFQNFIDNVRKVENLQLKTVLMKLLCLYGVIKILKNAKGCFSSQIVTGEGLKFIFSAKEKLLNELRNEAIGLVQAFGYDDNTLKSAIGGRDGKVYQTLLEWAKNNNRVNKPEVQKQILQIFSESKRKINEKNIPKL